MNPIYVIYGIILLVWAWRELVAVFVATKKNIEEVFELQKEYSELKKSTAEEDQLRRKQLEDNIVLIENSLSLTKQLYDQKGYQKNKDGSYGTKSNLGKEIFSISDSLAIAQEEYSQFCPETVDVDEPAKLMAKFLSKRLSSRLIAPITILGLFIPTTSDTLALPLVVGFISYLPLKLTYRFVYCRNFRKFRFPNKVKLFFMATPCYLLSALVFCFIIDTEFLHPQTVLEQESKSEKINMITNNTHAVTNTIKDSVQ